MTIIIRPAQAVLALVIVAASQALWVDPALAGCSASPDIEARTRHLLCPAIEEANALGEIPYVLLDEPDCPVDGPTSMPGLVRDDCDPDSRRGPRDGRPTLITIGRDGYSVTRMDMGILGDGYDFYENFGQLPDGTVRGDAVILVGRERDVVDPVANRFIGQMIDRHVPFADRMMPEISIFVVMPGN